MSSRLWKSLLSWPCLPTCGARPLTKSIRGSPKPIFSLAKKETDNANQENLYRGCSSGGSCSARAVAAHIFAITFAGAQTIRGTPAPLSYTAKGDGRLRCGGGCESSSRGLRLSRGVVVRAARIFDGRSLCETSKGRPAHRYWVW